MAAPLDFIPTIEEDEDVKREESESEDEVRVEVTVGLTVKALDYRVR